jgi:DNA-binding GntR family transcriptional regulator
MDLDGRHSGGFRLPKVMKLQREPLGRRAVQAIRDAIFSGEYKPGQRLVEKDVAERLGVSRNVVREAFWRLEAQGLVRSDDYKGKSLITFGTSEMIESIPLRTCLEALAARWAAARVTSADAARLRELAAGFTSTVTSMAAYAELDLELHKTIWKIAGNRHMELVLNRIAGPILAFQPAATELQLGELIRKEHNNLLGSHIAVVNAICAGKKDEAQAAMQKHVLDFWQGWLEHAAAEQDQQAAPLPAISDAATMVARWFEKISESGGRQSTAG